MTAECTLLLASGVLAVQPIAKYDFTRAACDLGVFDDSVRTTESHRLTLRHAGCESAEIPGAHGMRIRGNCHPHMSVFQWACGCPFACDWACMCSVYTTEQGHSLAAGESCADVETVGGAVVATSEALARRIATHGGSQYAATVMNDGWWGLGSEDLSSGQRFQGGYVRSVLAYEGVYDIPNLFQLAEPAAGTFTSSSFAHTEWEYPHDDQSWVGVVAGVAYADSWPHLCTMDSVHWAAQNQLGRLCPWSLRELTRFQTAWTCSSAPGATSHCANLVYTHSSDWWQASYTHLITVSSWFLDHVPWHNSTHTSYTRDTPLRRLDETFSYERDLRETAALLYALENPQASEAPTVPDEVLAETARTSRVRMRMAMHSAHGEVNSVHRRLAKRSKKGRHLQETCLLPAEGNLSCARTPEHSHTPIYASPNIKHLLKWLKAACGSLSAINREHAMPELTCAQAWAQGNGVFSGFCSNQTLEGDGTASVWRVVPCDYNREKGTRPARGRKLSQTGAAAEAVFCEQQEDITSSSTGAGDADWLAGAGTSGLSVDFWMRFEARTDGISHFPMDLSGIRGCAAGALRSDQSAVNGVEATGYVSYCESQEPHRHTVGDPQHMSHGTHAILWTITDGQAKPLAMSYDHFLHSVCASSTRDELVLGFVVFVGADRMCAAMLTGMPLLTVFGSSPCLSIPMVESSPALDVCQDWGAIQFDDDHWFASKDVFPNGTEAPCSTCGAQCKGMRGLGSTCDRINSPCVRNNLFWSKQQNLGLDWSSAGDSGTQANHRDLYGVPDCAPQDWDTLTPSSKLAVALFDGKPHHFALSVGSIHKGVPRADPTTGEGHTVVYLDGDVLWSSAMGDCSDEERYQQARANPGYWTRSRLCNLPGYGTANKTDEFLYRDADDYWDKVYTTNWPPANQPFNWSMLGRRDSVLRFGTSGHRYLEREDAPFYAAINSTTYQSGMRGGHPLAQAITPDGTFYTWQLHAGPLSAAEVRTIYDAKLAQSAAAPVIGFNFTVNEDECSLLNVTQAFFDYDNDWQDRRQTFLVSLRLPSGFRGTLHNDSSCSSSIEAAATLLSPLDSSQQQSLYYKPPADENSEGQSLFTTLEWSVQDSGGESSGWQSTPIHVTPVQDALRIDTQAYSSMSVNSGAWTQIVIQAIDPDAGSSSLSSYTLRIVQTPTVTHNAARRRLDASSTQMLVSASGSTGPPLLVGSAVPATSLYYYISGDPWICSGLEHCSSATFQVLPERDNGVQGQVLTYTVSEQNGIAVTSASTSTLEEQRVDVTLQVRYKGSYSSSLAFRLPREPANGYLTDPHNYAQVYAYPHTMLATPDDCTDTDAETYCTTVVYVPRADFFSSPKVTASGSTLQIEDDAIHVVATSTEGASAEANVTVVVYNTADAPRYSWNSSAGDNESFVHVLSPASTCEGGTFERAFERLILDDPDLGTSFHHVSIATETSSEYQSSGACVQAPDCSTLAASSATSSVECATNGCPRVRPRSALLVPPCETRECNESNPYPFHAAYDAQYLVSPNYAHWGKTVQDSWTAYNGQIPYELFGGASSSPSCPSFCANGDSSCSSSAKCSRATSTYSVDYQYGCSRNCLSDDATTAFRYLSGILLAGGLTQLFVRDVEACVPTLAASGPTRATVKISSSVPDGSYTGADANPSVTSFTVVLRPFAFVVTPPAPPPVVFSSTYVDSNGLCCVAGETECCDGICSWVSDAYACFFFGGGGPILGRIFVFNERWAILTTIVVWMYRSVLIAAVVVVLICVGLIAAAVQACRCLQIFLKLRKAMQSSQTPEARRIESPDLSALQQSLVIGQLGMMRNKYTRLGKKRDKQPLS